MLDGRGRVAGVIGWPIEHSLSPRLHNYWLKQYGINGAYIPLAVRPEDLAAVITALPKMGLRGANLTIPHKEAVLPMLDHIEEEARIIGAVNTITIGDDGSIRGSNTDAYGFIENIRPHLPQWRNKAVVLGSGGAAHGVCYALNRAGFREIVIVNRTQSRAEALAARFGGAVAMPWDRRGVSLADADLLVNTTSLGLAGGKPLGIVLDALPAQALVTDIVYTPLETPLLESARARGNPVVDGLGMLIHQAVPGFAAWFGRTPEMTEDVRRTLTG